MGDPKAFLNIPRQEAGYRPVNERIADYSQVEQTLNTNSRKLQASRCMDCGVPFCHWACPIGNKQPEWQDALYRGKWKEAYEVLSSTCDFPEFTGRICPALCEKSCVLKLSCDQPVTIRENEAAIVEAAFREGYIQVKTPRRNGKKVAVIGAGPAGLVVANQLNLKGYSVTLFDKDEAPGGLLRFGIPNFKLDKNVIDRRMKILAAEGILFEMGVEIDVNHLPEGFDAYCICTGTPAARDLSIPGRGSFCFCSLQHHCACARQASMAVKMASLVMVEPVMASTPAVEPVCVSWAASVSAALPPKSGVSAEASTCTAVTLPPVTVTVTVTSLRQPCAEEV